MTIHLHMACQFGADGLTIPITIDVVWPSFVFRPEKVATLCRSGGTPLPPGSPPVQGFEADDADLFGILEAPPRGVRRGGWSVWAEGSRVAAGRVSALFRLLRKERTTRIWDYQPDPYFNVCVRKGLKLTSSGGHLYCDWTVPERSRQVFRLG